MSMDSMDIQLLSASNMPVTTASHQQLLASGLKVTSVAVLKIKRSALAHTSGQNFSIQAT